MDKVDLVKCPLCHGTGKKDIISGSVRVQTVCCWQCHGTGKVPKIEELGGLLFEAMVQDSVNLRQKLLWTNIESDLIGAGKEQIRGFEEAITTGLEEDYIIEEYKGHLERFKEWFEIFKMDLQVIVMLRDGSGSFCSDSAIDDVSWIIREK